jgi:hypothetical protein
MFYLTASADELKRASYGWINLEDYDLHINKGDKVQSVDFYKRMVNDKESKFKIGVVAQSGTRSLNARILFDNVYDDKKRCLRVNEDQIEMKTENLFEDER